MGQGSPDASVRSLVRLVLLFRLIALNVTIFELPGNPDEAPAIMVGLVVAAFVSFLALRYWDRWEVVISTRPVFLGLDLMLNLTIYAYLGADSPFFLYTLGTPLLAGVLFRTTGAVLLGGGMLAGYYVMVILGGNGLQELNAHEARDIQALVVLPALYPLAAAGGAAVRHLLDRQAETQLALASAERRAAAGAERARVAREMHDSLGKTLYGIALSARALSHRVADDAPDAAAAARDLSAAAQVAAEEARGLISDLRSDTLDRPLGDALEHYVREWSQRNGIEADLRADGVDLPHPGTRYELFCIVREALENVERHARGGRPARRGARRRAVGQRRRGRDRRPRQRPRLPGQRPLRARGHGRARGADRSDGGGRRTARGGDDGDRAPAVGRRAGARALGLGGGASVISVL